MVKFLSNCVKLEETAALIYHEFVKNQNCDDTLVQIWKDMARDEEDHANQLKLALRLPIKDVFSGIKDQTPDPEELSKIAQALLERAKQPDLSLLDMLKNAVVLEKEFRKVHALYALKFKDPKLASTFERLSRADDEHLEALNIYLKRYKAKHAG